MQLTMFQASHNTAVVSSTNLKRQYKKVKQLLDKNMMVILTNRNSEENVDGIIIPYSAEAVELLEDFLENLDIMKNKDALDKELKKSLSSGKGKRYSLKEMMDEEGMDR